MIWCFDDSYLDGYTTSTEGWLVEYQQLKNYTMFIKNYRKYIGQKLFPYTYKINREYP